MTLMEQIISALDKEAHERLEQFKKDLVKEGLPENILEISVFKDAIDSSYLAGFYEGVTYITTGRK